MNKKIYFLFWKKYSFIFFKMIKMFLKLIFNFRKTIISYLYLNSEGLHDIKHGSSQHSFLNLIHIFILAQEFKHMFTINVCSFLASLIIFAKYMIYPKKRAGICKKLRLG